MCFGYIGNNHPKLSHFDSVLASVGYTQIAKDPKIAVSTDELRRAAFGEIPYLRKCPGVPAKDISRVWSENLSHEGVVVSDWSKSIVAEYEGRSDWDALTIRAAKTGHHVALVLEDLLENNNFSWSEKDRRRLRLTWIVRCLDWTWVKEIKYHTCFLFSKSHGQETVERDRAVAFNDGHLFLGKSQWFLSRMINRHTFIGQIFRNTLLQGLKKGMPDMYVEGVQKAAEKHASVLGTEGTTPDDLLDEIARTSRDIFWSGHSEEKKPLITRKKVYRFVGDKAISSSGSVEHTRSEGGHQAEALERLGYDGYTCFLAPHEFEGYLEIRSWDPLDECWKRRLEPLYLTPVDIYREVFEKGPSWRFNQPISQVKFILEPLKVRTITKGQFENQFWAAPLQVSLWKCLQRFRVFELTGTPAHSSIVNRVILQMNPIYGEMVSGDFSAATDNMHGDACETAFRAAAGDLYMMSLLERSLGPSWVEYEGIDKNGKSWSCFGKPGEAIWPKPFLMKRGQLMGSVTSFPFLCVVNVAVLRYCFERFYGRRFSLDELPALINGDDILFSSEPGLTKLWRETCPKVGFDLSVGKNYVSSDFANINSTYFQIDRQSRVIPGFEGLGDRSPREEVCFCRREVPYVNFGLITGIKKGRASDDLDRDDLLAVAWANGRQVGDGLPDRLVRAVEEVWLRRNQDLVREIPCLLGQSGDLPSWGLKTERDESTSRKLFSSYLMCAGYTLGESGSPCEFPTFLPRWKPLQKFNEETLLDRVRQAWTRFTWDCLGRDGPRFSCENHLPRARFRRFCEPKHISFRRV